MQYRTDRHRNPTAFTTDLAKHADLVLGVDYEIGDPFTIGDPPKHATLYTAKIIGDPVVVTIRLINNVGFQNKFGMPRWIYVDMLNEHWNSFDFGLKKSFVALMYKHEGGTEMKELFL